MQVQLAINGMIESDKCEFSFIMVYCFVLRSVEVSTIDSCTRTCSKLPPILPYSYSCPCFYFYLYLYLYLYFYSYPYPNPPCLSVYLPAYLPIWLPACLSYLGIFGVCSALEGTEAAVPLTRFLFFRPRPHHLIQYMQYNIMWRNMTCYNI